MSKRNVYVKSTKEAYRKLGITSVKPETFVIRQSVVRICFSISCLAFQFLKKVLLLKNDRFFSTGVRNVAFFFGAISAQSPKKRRGKKGATTEEYKSDESNEEAMISSQVASAASQNWISNHPTIINEKLCPCINYWIALTTPNGAAANPIVIHRALLECGVETVAQQVCECSF